MMIGERMARRWDATRLHSIPSEALNKSGKGVYLCAHLECQHKVLQRLQESLWKAALQLNELRWVHSQKPMLGTDYL